MQELSSPPAASSTGSDRAVFARVVVGVDERPESAVAAAQASCLRRPGTRLDLLGVAETHLAAHAGFEAVRAAGQIVADAEAGLARVAALVPAGRTRLVSGTLSDVLAAVAERERATLVALGTRRRRGLPFLGATGVERALVRKAPSSVLVARPGWGPSPPHRVLVGVDATSESCRAWSVAESIGLRLGCEVVPVIALGGPPVGRLRLAAGHPNALLDLRAPVDALSAAPDDSLVVVGHATDCAGGRSSCAAEQVACGARCSVLVVRVGGGDVR